MIRIGVKTMSKKIDRSDSLLLISENQYQDDHGVWHDDPQVREVYCQVTSATNQEWHNANQNGLKAEYVFTVFFEDYEGEQVVEYNGESYSVIRTYRLDDDNIELHTGTKKGTQNE